jgi:5-methylcytosine-specific restriction endonuclease McrA
MSRWGQGAPHAWKQVRRQVLHRDHHTCQIREPGCTVTATTVDHTINLAALNISRYHPAALDPNNCQAACGHCHTIKTRREAARASAEFNRARAAARRQRLTLHRPHPGDAH